jgi:hypothetical protein
LVSGERENLQVLPIQPNERMNSDRFGLKNLLPGFFFQYPYNIYLYGFVTWLLTFLFFCLAFWPMRDLPYWWDAAGYVQSSSAEICHSSLFPILRQCDVGHPTFFYFVVAVFTKLVGNGVFAGHLATWAVCAVLPGSLYAMCRSLRMPRALSVMMAVLFVTTPLVWTSFAQILLDLPLTALTLAAYIFWHRKLYLGYFLFASAAFLTKIYGFSIICGPLGVLVLTSGNPFKAIYRGEFIKRSLWTLSPFVPLTLFVVVRYIVRGPGLTLNHQTIDPIKYLWNFGDMVERTNFFFRDVILSTNYHVIIPIVLGLIILALLLAAVFRWKGRVVSLPDSQQGQLFLLFFCWILGTFLMFLQVRLHCCPRYGLFIFAPAYIIGVYALWKILRSQYLVMVVLIPLMFVQIISWHPRHAKVLRPPLDKLLTAKDPKFGWNFEVDLQVLDPIRLVEKAGVILREDMDKKQSTGIVATGWPLDGPLRQPDYGYVKEGFQVAAVYNWVEVNLGEVKYLVELPPHYSMRGTQPPTVQLSELYREKRYNCELIIYEVRVEE